ncbi:hypothetical protein CIRG_09902 [Coccidioides immitis RMSCC 2394]|uniref:Uncharacterized protein n=1 Tax=Coccidioides immitis RMSCC 2394 TaxID=404692 RepID=A0A0J6YNH6_COCIT|nr:hypothetical protein CIRG_09902 [Coccidioides immitis RMSCC 2394]
MPESEMKCHLPEDFSMHGLIWSQLYYPPGFFNFSTLEDDEEWSLEPPALQHQELKGVSGLAIVLHLLISGSLLMNNRRSLLLKISLWSLKIMHKAQHFLMKQVNSLVKESVWRQNMKGQ